MNIKWALKNYLGLFPDHQLNCSTCRSGDGYNCYHEKIIKRFGDISRPGNDPVANPDKLTLENGCKCYGKKKITEPVPSLS
jgi:hypothetical protein